VPTVWNWHDRRAVSTTGPPHPVRFEPLRPASRRRIIVAVVAGPFLWLVALLLVAWLFVSSRIIQIGLLVTAVSLVVSVILLTALYAGRKREERRYVDSR
jgi:hypothetical protein